MAIHHDKMAYGKLKPMKEELSEDALLDLVRLLNEEEDEIEEKGKACAKKDEKQ